MTAYLGFSSCWVRFALVIAALSVFCGRAEAEEDPQILVEMREVEMSSEPADEFFDLDGLMPPPAQPADRSTTVETRVLSRGKLRKELASRPQRTVRRQAAKSDHDIVGFGVFTDPQFQVLIRAMQQKAGNSLFSLPSMMLPPGKAGLLEFGPLRYGVIGEVSEDRTSIELEIFLPHYGDGIDFADGLRPSLHLSIPDGRTVLCRRHRPSHDGAERFVFIKVQVMTPAGVSTQPADQGADMKTWLHHVVAKGESLETIAKHYGVKEEGIVALASLDNPSEQGLRAGEMVRVPVASVKATFPAGVLPLKARE